MVGYVSLGLDLPTLHYKDLAEPQGDPSLRSGRDIVPGF
jgi:hypothetical protein